MTTKPVQPQKQEYRGGCVSQQDYVDGLGSAY